jgi:hypothetical protein
MKNCLRILAIAVVAIAIASIPALAQSQHARDGSILGGPAPLPTYPMADILDEGFDDVFILEFEGWCMINNSSPLGTQSWDQGASTVFPAHAGSPHHYIFGNYLASGSPGDISLWLLSPEYDLGMVGNFSLWTRTVDGTSWPDRAQIRYSTAGSSCNVGSAVEDVGDFTNLLEDINPNETLDPPDTYPQEWTQYAYDMSAVNGSGRFAFRYYIHDSGPTGANSNYIGVDTWQLDSGTGDGGADDGGADDGGDVPATTTWGVIVLIALFLGITLFYLRRRARA